MGIIVPLQKLCRVEIPRLLLVMGMVVTVLIAFQCLELPFGKIFYVPLNGDDLIDMTVGNSTLVNVSNSDSSYALHVGVNSTSSSDSEPEVGYGNVAKGKHSEKDFASDDKNRNLNNEITSESVILDNRLPLANTRGKIGSSDGLKNVESRQGPLQQVEYSNTSLKTNDNQKTSNLNVVEVKNLAGSGSQHLVSPVMSSKDTEKFNADSRKSILFSESNWSSMGNAKQGMGAQFMESNGELLQTDSSEYMRKRKGMQPTSISQMNLLLVQNVASSSSMPRRLSAPDRELLRAKLAIEHAPILRSTSELYASIYRNVSIFYRSYELMEQMLKIYIYKEGGKPIFHQPKMNGIYASEGWFMKLIEGNKQIVVKDPRKAHLFYLPFSSQRLRIQLNEQNLGSLRGLMNFLDDYVDMIATKYRFWNRTGGVDHFIVACHDWALRITRQRMKNSIRALCNANAGRGFKIGKDAALPVTYIGRGGPLGDLGGKPPSERPTLAFFAGSMHGYLRPILLNYWENKEPDMKISGPMARDIQGKITYREHMKSSKYCICARGYEVHTPRVVEAILYECVPVILADNYVPPFFEVLNWESFAVFIQEQDIPNLRSILLSISEEKYLAMQSRVKMVQQHFLWHKKPLKYDLFHMILHSVWYNRILQMKAR